MSVKIEEEIAFESSSHNENKVPAKLDYEKLINTPEFKKLSKRKNKFLLFYSILFTAIYALLPVLTSYTNILENSAIGSDYLDVDVLFRLVHHGLDTCNHLYKKGFRF